MPSIPLVIAVTTLTSLVFTYIVRRYAIYKNILDRPNARSAHSIPTPRGGGIAIVFTFLIGLLCLAILGIWPWPGLLGLGLAGAGVAIVGFLDDKGNITPKWRLLVHFTAATIVVYTVGGLPDKPGSPPTAKTA